MAAKTEAELAFDAIVAEHIAPLLKAAGFKKSGLNWRKRGDIAVGVVQVQKSYRGSKNDIRFTINLGARFDEVHRADYPNATYMWDKEPTEPDCHVRSRIGQLAPVKLGVWWNVLAASDAAIAGTAAASLLAEHGLPWLASTMDDASIPSGILAKRLKWRDEHLPKAT